MIDGGDRDSSAVAAPSRWCRDHRRSRHLGNERRAGRRRGRLRASDDTRRCAAPPRVPRAPAPRQPVPAVLLRRNPPCRAAELEHFTHVDFHDRVALVLEYHGEFVAWASYERWKDRDDAEVAFMVDDAFQGKGIATLLLEHLAAIARSNDIVRFTAEVLSDNRAMLARVRPCRMAGGAQLRQRDHRSRVVARRHRRVPRLGGRPRAARRQPCGRPTAAAAIGGGHRCLRHAAHRRQRALAQHRAIVPGRAVRGEPAASRDRRRRDLPVGHRRSTRTCGWRSSPCRSRSWSG